MANEQFEICEYRESATALSEQKSDKRSSSNRGGTPDKTKDKKEPPDRTHASWIIELEGEDLKKKHYAQFISEVYVEDTCDKIPIARVKFNNSEGRFTNDPLWDGNKKMKIFVGYPEIGLEQQVGTFYTRPARQQFDGKISTIIIEGWGEEVKMSFPEKRRVWHDMTDSEIATEIADSSGFEYEIDDTEDKFPQVTQANESDMNFLIKRAKLYGYIIYVKRGILHFHKPRYVFSGRSFNAQDSPIINLNVGVSRSFRAKQHLGSQIDPITQEIFTVEGSDIQDDLSIKTQEPYDQVDLWDSLMMVDDKVPNSFLVNQGHMQNKNSYQKLVDAKNKSSRWVIKGSGSGIGVEDIDAGETINLYGIGKWSGEYLITKIAHDYKGTYLMYFDVTRTWTQSSTEPTASQNAQNAPITLEDVLTAGQSAGEVEVA